MSTRETLPDRVRVDTQHSLMRSAKGRKRRANRSRAIGWGRNFPCCPQWPSFSIAPSIGRFWQPTRTLNLDLLGLLGLRQVAQVCEEHEVCQARAAGWTSAQIAVGLEVSPQAVRQRHAARLATSLPSKH
jgi:hypothetical protein